MNNLNFFTNSYFHCEPQLSQHVDNSLAKNAWSSQSGAQNLPTNGFNASVWSFSGTFGTGSLATASTGPPCRGNNNEDSTAIPQPVYAWMKKKRGKSSEKNYNPTEGKNVFFFQSTFQSLLTFCTIERISCLKISCHI